MAFLRFERFLDDGERFIRQAGKYHLAGWNNGLLYKAWEKKGKPLEIGWQVSADELIQIDSNGAHDSSTRLLGIDWHPNLKIGSGIGIRLIELLNVYAFTWQGENEGAAWTPLMLEFQTLADTSASDAAERKRILSRYKVPTEFEGLIGVEFLYLGGDEKSWNWGQIGQSNAAFIERAARDYFREFF